MHRRPPSSLVQNVPAVQPLRSAQAPTSFLPRVGRMKEEVEPLERLERLKLILVDSLLQERHYDNRQISTPFMRDLTIAPYDESHRRIEATCFQKIATLP